MSHSKIRVLIHSNYSRLVTGFGKNMKNVLLALYDDPEIELIEAANGSQFGADLHTPWESYGTYPSDNNLLSFIGNDGAKKRVAQYGFYTIDKIVEKVNPDVYLGVEDIWAFREFDKKPWWNDVKTIIWTTLDSLPILDTAKDMYSKCDQMLVWASFAEREMKKLGFENVKTLHGAVDYSHFHKINNRNEIRSKFGIDENFVIGFVFKNQLRKSVPNLLEGFKLFKKSNPDANPKLLLHTDWADKNAGWDIERYIKEKEINPQDVLATYVCHRCDSYHVMPYSGENLKCPYCNTSNSFKTKNTVKGASEEQLNEIYNLMDVYCHPFTSGGQELPIQEAKSAGLITLVTDYSCGEDSCHPHQGGLPLSWHEYREPSTQFIKASTDPKSICENLEKVLNMNEEDKQQILENGRKNIKEKFSVKATVEKLKEIIKETAGKQKKFDPNSEEESEEEQKLKIEDLLDEEGEENRVLVSCPDSASSAFMINALVDNLKDVYPEKNIYISTNIKHKPLLDDNLNIHRIIPESEAFNDPFVVEGRLNEKGYFGIAFIPSITTDKIKCYTHNGMDKIQFFQK